jgi:hypothetical protein
MVRSRIDCKKALFFLYNTAQTTRITQLEPPRYVYDSYMIKYHFDIYCSFLRKHCGLIINLTFIKYLTSFCIIK